MPSAITVTTKNIGEDIFEIVLRLNDLADFSFSPGQFVEILIPELAGNHRDHRREFTILSIPDELPDLKIAIRHSGSMFKKHLIENQDLVVFINGPYGNFVLPETVTRPIYLIAGGIGLTPFMSMLKQKAKESLNQKRNLNLNKHREMASFLAKRRTPLLKLIWSNKIKIKPWLETLRRFKKVLPNFDFSWQPKKWSNNQLKNLPKDSWFYIAGPIGMVIETKKTLREAGVAPENIFTDDFTGY